MSQKRPTSYDVAILAGVSQSAVSRVFSPSGSASPVTREKVLNAARTLGFKPNPIARSLSLGRSRLAGLIVTQYTQQNYPVALKSAMRHIAETDDSLLIHSIDAVGTADEAIRQLLSKRVDILVCAADIGLAAANACKRASVPLVMINREPCIPGVDQVESPNAEIMRQVVALLHAKKVKRTAFLGGGERNSISVRRRQGFVDACAAVAMPAPLLLESDFSYDGGHALICGLSKDLDGLQAIVSANDPMALGAMDALRHHRGKSVPDDMLVIGHDNIEAAHYQAYQLTSIRQDMHGILIKAFELAYDRLANPERGDLRISILHELVERRSTTS